LFALGAGGVVWALIRFAPSLLTFVGGERQRQHEKARLAAEQRDRDRARLGPGLRVMIGVGQELTGIASRLINQPEFESTAAVGPLQDMRDRLHGVQEPDLVNLREEFHSVLTNVIQWRARVRGSYEDRQAQLSPADQHRLDRIDQHEGEEPGRIQELTAEAEGWLGKLENWVGQSNRPP